MKVSNAVLHLVGTPFNITCVLIDTNIIQMKKSHEELEKLLVQNSKQNNLELIRDIISGINTKHLLFDVNCTDSVSYFYLL